MNNVTIAFEPLKRYAKVYIDNEPISPYSDLSICESKDLHVCCAKLVKLFDAEFESPYSLTIQGDDFQFSLAKAFFEQSSYCIHIEHKMIPYAFALDDTVNFAKYLNNFYCLGINDAITLQLNESAAIDQVAYSIVREEECDLLIGKSCATDAAKGKTVLVLSDCFDINNNGGINIVTIPRDELNQFLEYFQRVTKVLPFIETVFLQSRYASLGAVDELTLNAYQQQSPQFRFEISKHNANVGESVPFKLLICPENHNESYLIRVNQPEMATIEKESIHVLCEGMVEIQVLNNSNELIETQVIEVQSHSYVETLRLIPHDREIEVGKRSYIEAYVLPEKAEDAHSIKWESSDNEIIHITSSGELIALRPGKVKIIASTVACRESVTVEVLPSLERIELYPSTVSMQAGEIISIHCTIYPQNAAHGKIIWELSNAGIGSLNISEDGKTCTFRAVASSFTKGVLKCTVRENEKTASCTIEIKPEVKPAGLMTCSITFSILGILGSFLIPLFYASGQGITGFFFDIFLPIGLLVSIVGRIKTDGKEKLFSTMLILDLIIAGIMFLLAITCCSPR